MAATLRFTGAIRCITYAGFFGAPSRKPFEIYCTWPTELFMKYLHCTQCDADAKLKAQRKSNVGKNVIWRRTGEAEAEAEVVAERRRY
eukprot:9449602-Pyramimonas_sp.AAC.1